MMKLWLVWVSHRLRLRLSHTKQICSLLKILLSYCYLLGTKTFKKIRIQAFVSNASLSFIKKKQKKRGIDNKHETKFQNVCS